MRSYSLFITDSMELPFGGGVAPFTRHTFQRVIFVSQVPILGSIRQSRSGDVGEVYRPKWTEQGNWRVSQ